MAHTYRYYRYPMRSSDTLPRFPTHHEVVRLDYSRLPSTKSGVSTLYQWYTVVLLVMILLIFFLDFVR